MAMKEKLKNTRGETIVEVVVAFLLLMLFTAVFAAALRYAQAMNLKGEQLRETAYQLCGAVYPFPANQNAGEAAKLGEAAGSALARGNYTFTARRSDGTLMGITFTVNSVGLHGYEATVAAGESATGASESYTFHSYGTGVGG